jgi:hypothetical protein
MYYTRPITRLFENSTNLNFFYFFPGVLIAASSLAGGARRAGNYNADEVVGEGLLSNDTAETVTQHR